jgi:hypothetical protein
MEAKQFNPIEAAEAPGTRKLISRRRSRRFEDRGEACRGQSLIRRRPGTGVFGFEYIAVIRLTGQLFGTA